MPRAMNVVPLHPSAVSQFTADVQSFLRHLRAARRSPNTIAHYEESLRSFERFLLASGRDLATSTVTKRDVQDYILDQQERVSDGTVVARFRVLRAFFNWAVRDEVIDASPMDRMPQPAQQERPPDILTDDQIAAMLRVCSGRGFEDRRDTAILRLLIDTGMRRSEVGNLSVEDVDIDQQIARVVGKGDRVRYAPFGDKTAVALDKYRRLRDAHKYGRLPELWISAQGPMRGQGIAWVVDRRARMAGVGHVHAHQFRHTFAHLQKRDGVPDEVIERTAGWRPGSPMLRRYGSAAADERARALYRQHRAPGDRL